MRKIILFTLLLMLQGNHIYENKLFDYRFIPTKSGYYISLHINKFKSEKGYLLFELEKDKIARIDMKNKVECEFVLNKNTGLLNYDGYKNLYISYLYDSNVRATDSFSILGYESNIYKSSNNSVYIDYVLSGDNYLYSEAINILDNPYCVLPKGIITDVSGIYTINCESEMIPFLTFQMELGKTRYNLDLNCDPFNKKFYLNCNDVYVDCEPGLIDASLDVKYSRYFDMEIEFKESFLVKNIFAEGNNPCYYIEFSVYE